MRANFKQPTLLNNGYELVEIPTVVTEERFSESGKSEEGKAYIKDVYFAECKRIIQEVAGGVDTIIPVSFRMREQKGEKESTTKKLGNIESRYAPRPVAHLDRDTPTAITVLEETVGKEKAQELLSKHKRWAQVNVWRPIGKQSDLTHENKHQLTCFRKPGNYVAALLSEPRSHSHMELRHARWPCLVFERPQSFRPWREDL